MKLIPLSKGKFAKVDDQDFAELSKYSWHFRSNGYAARTIGLPSGKTKVVKMHRQIMGENENLQIDHKNHDKLDSRRENLRFCTVNENTWNRPFKKKSSSGYRGVYRHGKGFQAVIGFNGKLLPIRTFSSILEAVKARNSMAKKLHGRFAVLNKV